MPNRGSVLGEVVGGLPIRGVAMRWEAVYCECADPACACEGKCRGRACYEWGSVAEGDWRYLCQRCGFRMVARGRPEAVE